MLLVPSVRRQVQTASAFARDRIRLDAVLASMNRAQPSQKKFKICGRVHRTIAVEGIGATRAADALRHLVYRIEQSTSSGPYKLDTWFERSFG